MLDTPRKILYRVTIVRLVGIFYVSNLSSNYPKFYDLISVEIVTVGIVTSQSQTVQEGNSDDVISACFEILSGNVTRTLTVTGVASSVTAIGKYQVQILIPDSSVVTLLLKANKCTVCALVLQ